MPLEGLKFYYYVLYSPMVFEVLRGGLNVLYHVSKLVFEVLHRLKGRCALSLETLFEA